MTEFALVLPLLLLVMWGTIEAGRFLFIYVSVSSASREAARYGAAAGLGGGGVARYRDCDGIRAAAQRIGTIAGIDPNSGVLVGYDNGDASNWRGSCPAGSSGPVLNDPAPRVVVTTSVIYNPIVPLVPFARDFPVRSVTARTILKDIVVGEGAAGSTSGVFFAFGNPPYVYENPADGPTCVDVTLAISPTVAGTVTAYIGVESSAADDGNPNDDYTVGGNTGTGVLYNTTMDNPVIPVCAIDDLDYDPGETITMTIVAVDNGMIGSPQSHVVHIIDDEPPFVTFEQASGSSPENTQPEIWIAITDHNGNPVPAPFPIEVNLVSLGSPAPFAERDPHPYWDFRLSGTVTFAAGERRKPIPTSFPDEVLYVRNDDLDEADEVFTLRLSSPQALVGTIATYVHTIVDDDDPPQVVFSIPQSAVPESIGVHPVQVELLHPVLHTPTISGQEVSVGFHAAGSSTATSPADYSLPPSPLIIPAYSSTGAIDVSIVQDSVAEEDETIELVIDGASNATIGAASTHTVVISSKLVSFETLETVYDESSGNRQVEVAVVLSTAHTEQVRVRVNAADGTAVLGQDFNIQGVSGSSFEVVFPPGSVRQTFRLNFINDNLDENDVEEAFLTLSDAVNASIHLGTHTLRIRDDDAPPTIAFTQASQSADEGTTVQVTARLSQVSGRGVSFDYLFSGTAEMGPTNDFTASSVSGAIPAGQLEYSVTLTLREDLLDEYDEYINIGFANLVNASPAGVTSHRVNIRDMDDEVSIYFQPESQIVMETQKSPVIANLYLSHRSAKEITVTFSVGGTASQGVDYTLVTPTTFTIPPNTSGPVPVRVSLIDDPEPDHEETVILTLVSAVNARLATTVGFQSHTIMIEDNEDLDCESLFSLNVTAHKKSRKIDIQLTNLGSTDVTIRQLDISWLPSGFWLENITYGDAVRTDTIWVAPDNSYLGGASISSGWVPGSDLSLPSMKTKTLIFALDYSNSGWKLESMQNFRVYFHNSTCEPSSPPVTAK